MTKNRKHKQAARQRSQATETRYARARRQVRVPTWFNQLARKSCSDCGAPVEWVDSASAAEHGMDVAGALDFLGAPVSGVQFWVCTSCESAGALGPEEGDLPSFFEDDGDLDDGDDLKEPEDSPLIALLDQALSAYRRGTDPSIVLRERLTLSCALTSGVYDAVSLTMGTHSAAALWRLRGSRDTVDKLVTLVGRRVERRLSSSNLAGQPAAPLIRRCLVGWFEDARDRELSDADLTKLGLGDEQIPASFSGAAEWLAKTDDEALAITAASVALHGEFDDMYEAITVRRGLDSA